MLDPKILTAIRNKVERQFPEVAGSKPEVRLQHPPQAKNAPATPEDQPLLYLVTFRGTIPSPVGKSIQRLVRVVVNSNGKIVKITTSR
jgi:hypothetical protein